MNLLRSALEIPAFCVTRLLVLCVIGAGALVTHAADKPAADPAKDKDFDAPKTFVLELQVVDKELGEPIPKMQLAVRADNARFAYTTDESGRASIEYPADAKYFTVAPKSETYVPVISSWRVGVGDRIPATYKLELERGTTVGGVIQDEAGKGVANVAVELFIPMKQGADAPREQSYLNNYPVKTDAEGKWHCDVVPKEIERLYINLTHPDYASDDGYVRTLPPIAKLRDQTAVMVLSKGIEVGGQVVDQDGKPINKAKVAMGPGTRQPAATTDKEGRFLLHHQVTSAMSPLTVNAPGHAPLVQPFDSKKDVNDLQLKLQPGHVLRVRVINAKGQPLAGAGIAVQFWHGNQSLNWRSATDKEGRATWNEAPSDGVMYSIWGTGYVQATKTLTAGDGEQTVTLVPQLKVTGSVVDAQSGKPIEKFRVVRGWTSKGSGRTAPFWTRDDSHSPAGENGKFEYVEDYERDGYATRIEAEGYQPAESREFKADEGTVALEFKLAKAVPLVGTLQTPDGKALAGAKLLVVTGSSQIFINNGEAGPSTFTQTAKTDDNGRFNLPPQIGTFTVLVVHDAGFAELTPEQLNQDRVTVIKPWGRVEGTVRRGSKAGANLTLTVLQSRQSAVHMSFESKASSDEKGHFVIEHLAAGRSQIGIEVTRPNIGGMSVSWTQRQNIEVESGKTLEVDIGGKGRPVVGQIVPPADIPNLDWNSVEANISSRVTASRRVYPANWPAMDAAAKRKSTEEWMKTPEGLELTRQQENRRYDFIVVAKGGAFRLDDLPAGPYVLGVTIQRPYNPADRRGGLALAAAHLNFTIPEMRGGRSDEPLDVGKIELSAVAPTK